MADYLLDTHACVFALAAPRKLGSKARQALRQVEEGAGIAWIPAAVVAEIVLLRELGRIGVGVAELKDAWIGRPACASCPSTWSSLMSSRRTRPCATRSTASSSVRPGPWARS